jgi:hypothetical protein
MFLGSQFSLGMCFLLVNLVRKFPNQIGAKDVFAILMLSKTNLTANYTFGDQNGCMALFLFFLLNSNNIMMILNSSMYSYIVLLWSI